MVLYAPDINVGFRCFLQDPNKPVIRLYKLPEGTFSSDEEDESSDEEDEDGDDESESDEEAEK